METPQFKASSNFQITHKKRNENEIRTTKKQNWAHIVETNYTANHTVV